MNVVALSLLAASLTFLPGNALARVAVTIPANIQRGVDQNDVTALLKASEYYLEAACPTEGSDNTLNILRDRQALQQGMALLDKAARLGSVPAARKLGDLHSSQHCSTRNVPKALEYYHMGAKADDIDCIMGVGRLYTQSNKYTEAYQWLMKGAKLNSYDAFNMLSMHYFYGYTGKPDYVRAYASVVISQILRPQTAQYMQSIAVDSDAKMSASEKKMARDMVEKWKRTKTFE